MVTLAYKKAAIVVLVRILAALKLTEGFAMTNPTQVAPNFIDAQDIFNQTMCQAQAMIAALSGDDQFTHMKSDHVASLLFLTEQHLEQLNASFNDLLTSVKNGGSL